MRKTVLIVSRSGDVKMEVTAEFQIDTSAASGYDKENANKMVEERVDTLLREVSDMTGVPIQNVKLRSIVIRQKRKR
ncbi:MAG TPA: hypothetical protein VKO45_09065 [Methanomicrobiales archaeon]|nr:hypothetical protein [Methanomicrobiales archaeon]